MTAVVRYIKYLTTDELERALRQLEELLAPGQRAELNARFASDAPLTWDEARQLAAYGGSIGSHCHDHILLHNGLPPNECQRQIVKSRRRLLDEIGSVEAIAYPNGGVGDFSRIAMEEAKRAGFRLAFTTVPTEVRCGDSRFALPRVVAEDLSTTSFLTRSTRFRHRSFSMHVRSLLVG